ncbi:hypothetical protein PL75_03450 [Neisseria arctica]|uniref:Phosphoribosyl-ATP pyrophosphohydrolase n=2 Tax=Neisseria arctica TaxID=1470200 RepID=A0A0J0YTF5_9NEIS|nr:hypothetical protein PL75_03450 [Neisseria arctica]
MAREAWKQSKKSHDPLLSDILDWFKAAKPKPEQKDISVQLGCHIEEIAEMFEAIMRGSNLGKHLANNAQNFKACESANLKAVELIRESKSRQVELLDALCDQIVTALGVGYMMGFDIDKALSEVNRSNWSKFVDGQPVFDDNGKIKKGGSYTPPDLKPYINQD